MRERISQVKGLKEKVRLNNLIKYSSYNISGDAHYKHEENRKARMENGYARHRNVRLNYFCYYLVNC